MEWKSTFSALCSAFCTIFRGSEQLGNLENAGKRPQIFSDDARVSLHYVSLVATLQDNHRVRDNQVYQLQSLANHLGVVCLKRNKISLAAGKKLGNENSAEVFLTEVFFETPWGHGRPRLRVMDVRTKMRVFFAGFRGLDRSFCPRTSAGISAWMSAGYPAPKLTLWAVFRS